MPFLKKLIIHTANLQRLSELSVKVEEIFESLEKVIVSSTINSLENISHHLKQHRIEKTDTAFYIALFKNNPAVAEHYKNRIDRIYASYLTFKNQNSPQNTSENDLKMYELLGLYILSLEQLLIQTR